MIAFLLCILLFLYSFHLLYWKRRLLPPGPTPLPIIGSLYLMTNAIKPGYKLYKQLTEKYGPVYTIWMANLPMVVVTDWELIKETFIKDGGNYVGRPEFPISIELRKGPYGIIEAFGDRWQKHRRFALHVLRNFGLGKNLMEERVIGELTYLIDNLKKACKEGSIDMLTYFDASIGSVINSILFGYRYDETNIDEFLTLKDKMNKHFRIAAEPIGGVIGMYPFLGELPIIRRYKKMVVDNWGGLFQLFRKQVEEKLKTINYDNPDEYSDFVEAFLKERKKHENSADFGSYELEQLDSVCFDLWVAGMETTSNTLYWSFLYVLSNPEVVKNIQKELDNVINSDRIITSSDRNELHYINATINEGQRLGNILPMNLARQTTSDVQIGNYKIPKDTVVIPQISQVMYDERYFENPYEFNPSRFLDEFGKLKKVDEFVPFSIGKRQCLGEGLAKLELFIFFANLFNQFEMKFDEANARPSLEKDYGITMKATSYKIEMKPRF